MIANRSTARDTGGTDDARSVDGGDGGDARAATRGAHLARLTLKLQALERASRVADAARAGEELVERDGRRGDQARLVVVELVDEGDETARLMSNDK